jgi:hypothetical protein
MNEQTEHTQKIVDLERELQFRDRRINELKNEIDGLRQEVREMEDWVTERDAYLEQFITTFGLELDNDGSYRNGDFIQGHQRLADKYNDLVGRHNKLIRRFNANIASVQSVGRPLAASEAQQFQILKLHKAGKSSRWIAEELTVSRRAVTTVIDKGRGHRPHDHTTSPASRPGAQAQGLAPGRHREPAETGDQVAQRRQEAVEGSERWPASSGLNSASSPCLIGTTVPAVAGF